MCMPVLLIGTSKWAREQCSRPCEPIGVRACRLAGDVDVTAGHPSSGKKKCQDSVLHVCRNLNSL